jgi:hypothetical protein
MKPRSFKQMMAGTVAGGAVFVVGGVGGGRNQ